VRQAAPQMVTASAQSADGVVHALTIAPHVAEALAGEAADDELPIPRLSAEDHAQLTRELVARVAQQTVRGRTPVVVCRDDIRELVEELARSAALGLLVVGWGELSPDARFVQVAQLGETLEPAPASREGPE
jgi:flagellar biosynthesis component FlhA